MDPMLRRDMLFDAYQGLLTERQRDAFRLHYHDDLSYGEMGEVLQVSRPAALDLLQRAQMALEQYESKLHFVDRQVESDRMHRQLLSLIRSGRCLEAATSLEHLLDQDGAWEEGAPGV